MTNVKCVVKGSKGLWHEGNCLPEGTEVELSAATAASKRARGNVYAPGEYEGLQAGQAAALKASQDEKDARNPAPAKAPTKYASKGAGSKGS